MKNNTKIMVNKIKINKIIKYLKNNSIPKMMSVFMVKNSMKMTKTLKPMKTNSIKNNSRSLKNSLVKNKTKRTKKTKRKDTWMKKNKAKILMIIFKIILITSGKWKWIIKNSKKRLNNNLKLIWIIKLTDFKEKLSEKKLGP